MKAVIQDRYGEFNILKVGELPEPDIRHDEVIVKVKASSVNYGNTAQVKGVPFPVRFWSGLSRPKKPVPGGDISGVVVSTGSNVTRFKSGDEVFGDLADCGFGAWCEYAAVPERVIAHKPSCISFEEAAGAAQAAMVALQALRDKGNIAPGKKVLIVGASGGIGSFAVQIAKSYGAEVTGVCSGRNAELVLSLGADRIIDYTKEDFTKSGSLYDIIIAIAGFRSIYEYKNALSDNGIYVAVGGEMKQIFQTMLLGPVLSSKNGKKFISLLQIINQNDLYFIKELFESGKIKTVIDRTFPMEDVVSALNYYSTGRARGKIVLTI